MRGRRLRGGSALRLAAPILACMGAACATPALSWRDVRGGEPDAASLDEVPVCGHEIALRVAPAAAADEGGGAPWVEGELLAATPETVFVARQGRTDAVPVAAIRTVKVRVLDDRSGGLLAWTLVGTLPALWVFYVWVPMGLTLAASDDARGWAEGPPDPALLSQYARFPQGLPPGWLPAVAVELCPHSARAARLSSLLQPP